MQQRVTYQGENAIPTLTGAAIAAGLQGLSTETLPTGGAAQVEGTEEQFQAFRQYMARHSANPYG